MQRQTQRWWGMVGRVIRQPVVLDTDVGTNVDDILALLFLATDKTVELRAVTTVDGDVALRARHAVRVLRLLGRNDVPVYSGVGTANSDRPIWPVDVASSPEGVRSGGVEALVDIVGRSPDEVTVVAIGPLTNIAAAIRISPGWASSVRRLVVMGGDFSGGRAEHNLASDVDAAQVVLSSGMPAVWVGLDITTSVPFDSSDLNAIAQSPLASLIAGQARAWWNRTGRPSSHPHDALAVLAMLEPDLFEFGRSGFRLLADGSITPDLDAPSIDYVASVDAAAARASLHRRWIAALRRAGPAPG
jgi:purine nucleosidase